MFPRLQNWRTLWPPRAGIEWQRYCFIEAAACRQDFRHHVMKCLLSPARCGGRRRGSNTMSETVRKHKEYLFPAVATYYQEPLALVRGEGMYVWDEAGDRYLDCFGGVLTISVGHANPKVVQAVVDQAQRLAHTSALYAHQPQSDLAEKLARITPGRLKKSFFTSTGTEANDTAIMAAKTHTGRHEIVVLRHSYSGRSATALSAAGHHTWRPLPAQVAGIVHAHRSE